jgi:MFS transporter, DHA2 family, lincomycin resistance protein
VAGAAGIALMITIMSAVSASQGGGTGLTAGGTQAAFLIAAIVSLPLIVGAFFIRKPAEAPEGMPAAH